MLLTHSRAPLPMKPKSYPLPHVISTVDISLLVFSGAQSSTATTNCWFVVRNGSLDGSRLSSPANYRAPDNCLYLKQVLAQVLVVQGTLSGRRLVCRLDSYAAHLPLGICIHSLLIQLISSQPAVKTTPHGLIRTILAKRSACFYPCSVHTDLCLFLPLLPLGAQRLHGLKLTYPSCNSSCSGKMRFQKDLGVYT